MNKLSLIFLIFTLNFSYSQSKKELINTLIKSNYVQLDYNNMGNEFGILLEKITEKELYKLAESKNPILRTYAKVGLIEQGKGNVLRFLKAELEKNITIEVLDADLWDEKTTSSIVYETFFIKKTLDTLNYFKELEYSSVDSIVVKNKIFEQIDSTIIYSNCNLNHFILNRVFNRKYSDKYLPRIEKLAFDMNISYAFFYLIDNYSSIYNKKEDEYFIKKFPKTKFETNNEIMNLINYLSYLLESENETLYKIGIKELKKQEWRNHEFDFILDKIIQEKGIRI